MAILAAIVLLPSRAALINEILVAGLFALSLDLILGLAGVVSLGQAAFLGLGAYSAAILASAGLGRPDARARRGRARCGRRRPRHGAASSARLGPDAPHGHARRVADAGRTRQPEQLADRRRGRAQFFDGKGARPLPDRLFRDSATRRSTVSSSCSRCSPSRGGSRQSPFGLALAAIRENRLRAGALGIATGWRIIAIYTVSAAYAGVAGALLAQTTQIVSLDLFEFHRSADVMLMLIIGGAGYLYGGLIGAGVFIVLRDVISAATPEYWEFWIGALLIVLVMVGRERVRDLALRAAALYSPQAAREEAL